MEQNCLLCARLESLQNMRAISNFGCHFVISIFLWGLGFDVSFYYYYYYKILSKCTGKSICLESAPLKMSAKCARDLSPCTWNETSLCAGHMCQIYTSNAYVYVACLAHNSTHSILCITCMLQTFQC